MARKKARKKGRRRSPKKRKSTRRRPATRGPKRKVKGVMGRLGALIMGVGPPAIAGLDAASTAMAQGKSRNWSGLGTFQYGFSRFINNLTNGFSLGLVFTKPISIGDKAGGIQQHAPSSGVEEGALWKLILAGGTMMAVDWVASKLAGGRGTKIPMTNYYATGSV